MTIQISVSLECDKCGATDEYDGDEYLTAEKVIEESFGWGWNNDDLLCDECLEKAYEAEAAEEKAAAGEES